MVQPAPWWTPGKIWLVAFFAVTVFGVALLYAVLISGKNRLLKEAQIKLQGANDELETRVAERTRDLVAEVEAKERAHAELAQAQQHLMTASRLAGMADVATGILHNVGNVLNSVNVSATLVTDRLAKSPIENLAKAATMMEEQRENLAVFLSEDPKGKLLPGYFKRLAHGLIRERQLVQTEVKSLVKNVEHIKIIVSMQQSYAHVAGMVEEVEAEDLIESAIQIEHATYERYQIQLIRDYQPVPRLCVDRHKALQILVNLLNNAKYALEQTAIHERRVSVAIFANQIGHVCLRVTDNGVGIERDNLSQIFVHGFTTRKNGHGFGLHSSSNAAKEMTGSLSVHSDGAGKGATFTLELPVAKTPLNGAKDRS